MVILLLKSFNTVIWKGWLSHVLKQDIANLSIRLLTKKEMSAVLAHWELIPEIKALRDELAPDTLLTINGDIPDYQAGMELADKYGINGVMIGRGIFDNPFAFEKEPRKRSSKEMLGLLKLQLDLHDKYSTEEEPLPFRPLRRFFKIYVSQIPDADELRNQLLKTESTDEVRALLHAFEQRSSVGEKTPVR